MLSLIKVECPHCGARGQIMVPPVGALIIGPCPQCNELVVVFCGNVLALDKETMENGTTDDRRDHLMEVLTDFLEDHVAALFYDDVELIEGHSEETGGELKLEGQTSPISQDELERFRDIDLKLLDNQAYFKSVFGTDTK